MRADTCCPEFASHSACPHALTLRTTTGWACSSGSPLFANASKNLDRFWPTARWPRRQGQGVWELLEWNAAESSSGRGKVRTDTELPGDGFRLRIQPTELCHSGNTSISAANAQDCVDLSRTASFTCSGAFAQPAMITLMCCRRFRQPGLAQSVDDVPLNKRWGKVPPIVQ